MKEDKVVYLHDRDVLKEEETWIHNKLPNKCDIIVWMTSILTWISCHVD